MSDRLMMAALRFAAQVDRLDDSKAILLRLHNIVRLGGLNLFGVWRVPAKARNGERSPYSTHIHPSVSAKLMEEYWRLFREHGRSFLADLAWRNKGSFTMTEALRAVKPSDPERWIVRLFHKYGMRDVFIVPNGAWMVVYWSPRLLRLDSSIRAGLQLAAGAAAARVARLTRHRDGEAGTSLSGRQRTVLRLVGQGYSLQEAADHMGIKYGTAQEHAERAAKKLEAKSLPHAVAEAMRRFIVIAIVASMAAIGIFEVYDICCWDEIMRWLV